MWKRAFLMPCKQVHRKISQHFFPPWPYRDKIFKQWIFVKLIGTICWFVRRLPVIQPTYYELHLTGLDEIWRGMSNCGWLHNMRSAMGADSKQLRFAWAAGGGPGSPSLKNFDILERDIPKNLPPFKNFFWYDVKIDKNFPGGFATWAPTFEWFSKF